MNQIQKDFTNVKTIRTEVFKKPILSFDAKGKVSIPISNKRGDNRFLLIDLDSGESQIIKPITGISSH